MPLIELPRALEEYFAYAEIDPTRKGRRFSITLPFFAGERLDRLQWWYHISPAEELMFEGEGIAVFRARATERFHRHIERWLANTGQHLHSSGAIPRISRRLDDEIDTQSLTTLFVEPDAEEVVTGIKVASG